MNRKLLLPKVAMAAVVLAALFVAPAAQAQLGAYGLVTVQRQSGIRSSPYTIQGASYRSSVDPFGGTAGVFYDFRTVGPVRLGADLRGTVLRTNRGAESDFNGGGVRYNAILGGVRASFHTPLIALKPYLQASAGLARTNYGLVYNNAGLTDLRRSEITLVNNLEYHGYVGLDVAVLPILDVRAFEVGYGGLAPFGGKSHNYPLQSVSAGLVFHLPTLH